MYLVGRRIFRENKLNVDEMTLVVEKAKTQNPCTIRQHVTWWPTRLPTPYSILFILRRTRNFSRYLCHSCFECWWTQAGAFLSYCVLSLYVLHLLIVHFLPTRISVFRPAFVWRMKYIRFLTKVQKSYDNAWDWRRYKYIRCYKPPTLTK